MHLLETIIQQDFFTPSTLGTLAGATFVVFAISSGIQSAFNFNPKWLALVISILVSFIGAYISMHAGEAPQRETDATTAHSVQSAGVTYLIAFINGFLIYASATGANQIVGHDHPSAPGGVQPSGNKREAAPTSKRKALTRWF
ncbi:MAG: hypothetical protein ACJ75B_14665 [Flavisolibacter sp.]